MKFWYSPDFFSLLVIYIFFFLGSRSTPNSSNLNIYNGYILACRGVPLELYMFWKGLSNKAPYITLYLHSLFKSLYLCSELVRVEFGPPAVACRLAISSHCLWAEVLHILLRLLVHNICIFQFAIVYNRVHLDLSGILVYCFFHLADFSTN